MKHSPEFFDTLNELLPNATPMGAYCVGMLSALAWQKNEDPPRALLEIAAQCPSIEKANEMWDYYWALRYSGSSAATAASELVKAYDIFKR